MKTRTLVLALALTSPTAARAAEPPPPAAPPAVKVATFDVDATRPLAPRWRTTPSSDSTN